MDVRQSTARAGAGLAVLVGMDDRATKRRIAIVFATHHGQTEKIAKRVAATMRAAGVDVDVVNVNEIPAKFRLEAYAGVVLAASVQLGHHEREMVAFVKAHRAEIEATPNAFFSVSMAAANAVHAPTAPMREKAASTVQEQLVAFTEATGWQPRELRSVAGALPYTKYDVVTRFVMRMIAKQSGASTDTSRDHEYTDWASLDVLAYELARAWLAPERNWVVSESNRVQIAG